MKKNHLYAQKTYSEELKVKAEKGDLQSQEDLAFCYLKGNGITKDTVAAEKWLVKLVGTHSSFYMLRMQLATIYEKQKRYDDAYPQYLEYYNEVVRKAKSKESLTHKDIIGVREAEYRIGEYKLYGRGVRKDIQGSIEYLKRSVANSYGPPACLNLCYAYMSEKDTLAAFSVIKTAYDKYSNNPIVGATLAGYYFAGAGCTKDLEKCYLLLDQALKAMENDTRYEWDARAWVMVKCGDLYSSKDFRQYDYFKAYYYYDMAYKRLSDRNLGTKGYVLRRLSNCYRFGRGCTKDLSKAESLLKEATLYGDETAFSLLNLM